MQVVRFSSFYNEQENNWIVKKLEQLDSSSFFKVQNDKYTPIMSSV